MQLDCRAGVENGGGGWSGVDALSNVCMICFNL